MTGEVLEGIRLQIADEGHAYGAYHLLAMRAEEAGLEHIARLLHGIADDEKRHYEILRQIQSEFSTTHRPFPKTYADWVDLALDIKKKAPELSTEVNECLMAIIGEGTGRDVDDAKRWLVRRAGELGIT